MHACTCVAMSRVENEQMSADTNITVAIIVLYLHVRMYVCIMYYSNLC